MTDRFLDRVEHGAAYPFDATKKWWQSSVKSSPPARDWAHAAARGVIADMTDRRGIKQELQVLDHKTSERTAFVSDLANIIRSQPQPIVEGTHEKLGKLVVSRIRKFGAVSREFEGIDDDVMDEIYDTVGRIILAAQAMEQKSE
ncbi:hypothetical protein YA0089_28060 [Pseudomonas viridiflava]|uniref:hypothetical protein n=1 Tax=Pseudomonas viridiflava TaxID=33069 RepID=UPI0018E66409|nr:hypothetical protein [Pseudomonas viridiflava]MBI6727477.1 hypothetical protein [Pseudomonas viridiflava]